jgi:hypothetical protein
VSFDLGKDLLIGGIDVRRKYQPTKEPFEYQRECVGDVSFHYSAGKPHIYYRGIKAVDRRAGTAGFRAIVLTSANYEKKRRIILRAPIHAC